MHGVRPSLAHRARAGVVGRRSARSGSRLIRSFASSTSFHNEHHQPEKSSRREVLAASIRALFRAHLREARHLPDSYVREWFKSHICSRFRLHRYGWEWHTMCASDDPQIMNKVKEFKNAKQPELFRAGRRRLAFVKLANLGDRKNLVTIFSLAYGKMGPRRQSLLDPFLRMDSSGPSQTDPIHSAMPGLHANNRERVPFLSPMFYELLRSQKAAYRGSSLSGPPQVSFKFRPPKLDVYERPTSQSRLVNMGKKERRRLIGLAIPPLPHQEFLRLEELACDAKAAERELSKRPIPSPPPMLAVPSGLHVALSLDKAEPIQRPTDPNDAHHLARSLHRITPRFMQNIWREMFVSSCYAIHDPERDKLTFKWGRISRRYPKPDDMQDAIQSLT